MPIVVSFFAHRILSSRDRGDEPYTEGSPACSVVASGGVLSEGYGHDEPRVCLGDGQTEAGGVPSQGGRGDALLRRMPPYLTRMSRSARTLFIGRTRPEMARLRRKLMNIARRWHCCNVTYLVIIHLLWVRAGCRSSVLRGKNHIVQWRARCEYDTSLIVKCYRLLHVPTEGYHDHRSEEDIQRNQNSDGGTCLSSHRCPLSVCVKRACSPAYQSSARSLAPHRTVDVCMLQTRSHVGLYFCLFFTHRLRQVTCIVRERQLRLYGYVARLPAEDPAHRILSCRDPRGWSMRRGRPHASWLRQMESYLKHAGMAVRASAWVMARRRPKQGARGDALLRRMPPYLT